MSDEDRKEKIFADVALRVPATYGDLFCLYLVLEPPGDTEKNNRRVCGK
jgi:hypothetical protein